MKIAFMYNLWLFHFLLAKFAGLEGEEEENKCILTLGNVLLNFHKLSNTIDGITSIWKYWDHLVSLINSNIRSDLEIFSYYHSIPICLSKLWDGFHSRIEYLPNQFIFQGYLSVRIFLKIGQAKSNFLFYFLFHFLSQLGNLFGCLSVCVFVSANPLSKASKRTRDHHRKNHWYKNTTTLLL